MDNFGKGIKRKVTVRRNTEENMGNIEKEGIKDNRRSGSDGELDVNYSKISDNLQNADQYKFQDGYNQIMGRKVSVLIKKILRKILNRFWGWYIHPIFNRQNHYNEKIIDAFRCMEEVVSQQKTIIHIQEQNIQKQEQNIQRNRNQISELKSELHKLYDSVQCFQLRTAPELRKEINIKKGTVVNAIYDDQFEKMVAEVKDVSSDQVDLKLKNATDYFYDVMQQNMIKEDEKHRDLIVVFCIRFKNEFGMEAIKNEAYDLYQLLQKKSIYDVKLISLEDEVTNVNYQDSIIYIDENHIEDCFQFLSPSLVVFCESTPYNVLGLKGVLVKNHTLIKISAQNPLQGFDQKMLDELCHCNDYGVHKYVVESKHAYDIMIQNGFRNVTLSFPIINMDRIKNYKEYRNTHDKFVVGFATSPMEKKHYDDRGMDFITDMVIKMTDINFRILWRNDKLALPEQIKNSSNCIISFGKYDMEKFFDEVDCVIIPHKTINNNHACSLSGVEAMLNNIPVLSTSVAGISDLVEKSGMGIVCEPNSDDIILGLRQIRENYHEYIGRDKVGCIRDLLDNNNNIIIVEEMVGNYFSKSFVTLEEWDYHLHQKDKYLVKGHDSIKKYYQNKEIADNYNEVRFLTYPANCFDAFERASIRLIVKNQFNRNNLEVLDIASGDGRIVQECIQFGFCTSIDSSRAMLDIVERKFSETGHIHTKICDYYVDNLDEKFDIITTFRYIRHFDYTQRKELYKRICNNLKDDGMLIFDAPNIEYALNDAGNRNWGDYNIYDIFWTEKDIIKELAENNLTVKYLIPIPMEGKTEGEVISSWTVGAVKQ